MLAEASFMTTLHGFDHDLLHLASECEGVSPSGPVNVLSIRSRIIHQGIFIIQNGVKCIDSLCNISYPWRAPIFEFHLKNMIR